MLNFVLWSKLFSFLTSARQTGINFSATLGYHDRNTTLALSNFGSFGDVTAVHASVHVIVTWHKPRNSQLMLAGLHIMRFSGNF